MSSVIDVGTKFSEPTKENGIRSRMWFLENRTVAGNFLVMEASLHGLQVSRH